MSSTPSTPSTENTTATAPAPQPATKPMSASRVQKAIRRTSLLSKSLKGRDGFQFVATGRTNGLTGDLCLMIVTSSPEAANAIRNDIGNSHKGWPVSYYARV